jgi:tRNA (guanine-N7-)-methyltransferase
MGQKKLIRFEELTTFPNVLQYPQNMAGKWSSFFPQQSPITLELACGKGEYAVGMAEMYSERNFIGVDQKGNRIWVGAKKALNTGIKNVAFLRTQIDRIATYFVPNEVEEIWLTFPDPQLRASKHKKRLTHPKYLRLYQSFLKRDGRIHLKTDSPVLYNFTLEVISLYHLCLHSATDNLYNAPLERKELGIKTHYEGLDIAGSKKIHYISFSLNEGLLSEEKDSFLKNWVFENEKPDAAE